VAENGVIVTFIGVKDIAVTPISDSLPYLSGVDFGFVIVLSVKQRLSINPVLSQPPRELPLTNTSTTYRRLSENDQPSPTWLSGRQVVERGH
jgi:hypothetical protein